MATVQTVISSERWLDEILLYGTVADGAGSDWSDALLLPPGLGDVAIMELLVLAETLATAVAIAEQSVVAQITSPGGSSTVDILGTGKWFRTQALRAAAYVSPDPLVLWHQDERLSIQSPELDSNASPTGDVFYYVKCVRVRPVLAAASNEPIRLVR